LTQCQFAIWGWASLTSIVRKNNRSFYNIKVC